MDEALDHRGMTPRLVGKGGARRRGGQAGEIDVVLDREGDAIQWQLRGVTVQETLRMRAQGLGVEPADPDTVWVVTFRAADDFLHDVARGELAGQVAPAQSGDIEWDIHVQPPGQGGLTRTRRS